MRIRRKAPKPSRTRPLYILGYRGSFPTPAEIQFWFDVEYGGPLRLQERSSSESALVMATHGPWTAAIERLSDHDALTWRDALGWDHPAVGQILPTSGQASDRLDQVLLAARLARGITLLTQGTAYDMVTEQYLNPSDWQDRALRQFAVRDHVQARQSDASDDTVEWVFTRGLSKFGVDELETFSPRGLPVTPLLDTLLEIAQALVGRPHPLTVGTELELSELALRVKVLRHRTASPGGLTIPLREISWSPLTPRG